MVGPRHRTADGVRHQRGHQGHTLRPQAREEVIGNEGGYATRCRVVHSTSLPT
jgi:hypothetical protein